MDQGPLVTEQIEGGARFLVEFQKYAPIQTAFWLKESDTGEWYLYVASEHIDDENFDIGYGEVVRIAHESRDPVFDYFQVKLIGADERLAKAALDARRRYPAHVPARLRGTVLGGLAADEVYLYPSPLPVPVA